MTPTEKDAMALAVLDAAAVDTEHTLGCPNLAGRLREARAHLASRIAELEAERQSLLLQVEAARMESSALKDRRSTLLNECDSLEARATRAEADLAAAKVDAERGREISVAFLPVMEAMRPLVLNLERLKDAARGGE